MGEMGILTIADIPEKFDRTYSARDRTDPGTTYEVNLAHLSCTCRDFTDRRASFPPEDARRVCVHLYDKLYQTKVERTFDPLIQLFIRYGREMLTYRLVEDDFGRFVIGFPFGPRYVRAIGVMQGRPLLATYDLEEREWSGSETPLSKVQSVALLERMRGAYPENWKGA